jgi:outer membrane protein TolC
LDVTATQAQLLQSENDLSDSDTQIAIGLVNLYRALGGGWEVADVAFGSDRAPRQKIGTP